MPGTEPQKRGRERAESTLAASVELVRLLELYLAELEAGRAPDRDAFLAAHPSHAASLAEALAGLEFIHRASDGGAETPRTLGDFRIVREVGRGGMGVVYEAEQISLKRRVALKVLRSGPVADPVALQRFQREAETVGRLHHTHIVPIYAIGEAEGVRYFAMQFIEGRDLGRVAQDARTEGRPVDAARVVRWGLAAAEALAHAHEQGVIHRDIKPSNLLLDEGGRLWLTDFGLARRVDDLSLSLTGTLLGTPRYMSPEQAMAVAARPIDHRTDLYSLGATLYELATGHPIFDAGSPHEVLSMILSRDPVAPRILAPGLPRDLETLLLTCLAKEPERRYATAADLGDDLRAIAEGRPIRARRAGLGERVVRWVKRHRRLVVTGVASAVAAVLVTTVGWAAWRAHRQAGLARFRPSTSEPQIHVELLDLQGRTIAPLSPAAQGTPMQVPAGRFELRSSAPGVPSESLILDLPAGTETALHLGLRPRWRWTPRALARHESLVEILSGTTGADLLVLDPVSPTPTSHTQARPEPHRIRRVRGTDGLPAWPADLVFDESSLPAGGDRDLWRDLMASGFTAPLWAGSGLADRARDLDGDGVPDLVLPSRSGASLLAVSGKEGRVLWWHVARPTGDSRSEQRQPSSHHPGQSYVVGSPAVADLDGDGVADVVACFWTREERVSPGSNGSGRGTGQGWVAAVSGRDGRELWQQSVDEPWADYVASSQVAAAVGPRALPQVMTVGDRPRVLLPVGDGWQWWDGASGAPVGNPVSAGFRPDHAPVPAPARGSDAPVGVFVRRDGAEEGEGTVEWVSVNLVTGTVLWRRPAFAAPMHQLRTLGPTLTEWGEASDLENDGRFEWIVPTQSKGGPDRWRFGVEAIDGTSGRPRWSRVLNQADFPQSVPEDSRFRSGPDLDGDGVREVMAVFPAYEKVTASYGIRAVAVSGATGKILWDRHHPGLAGVRTLAWWQPGTDGHAQLVLAGSRFSGQRSLGLILESGSGRVASVLSDVETLRIADLDGDGALDLLYPLRSGGEFRWHAVRGQPPEIWRHSGEGEVLPDLDGDGVRERIRLTGGRLEVRHGRTGDRVWGMAAEMAQPSRWHVCGERDAEPRLVMEVSLPRRASDGVPSAYRSLRAYRLRDGRELWTASGADLGWGQSAGQRRSWAFGYPRVHSRDLDADGHSEILVAGVTEDAAGAAGSARLTVVSGADGSTWWETRLEEGAMGEDPAPSGLPVADFNRDGVLDLALFGRATRPGAPAGLLQLQVRDGRKGTVLPWTGPAWESEGRHLAWPQPVLGDLNGDGIPELVVTRHRGMASGGRGYIAELAAVDGTSGDVRWTWSWESGFPEVWPPLFLPAGKGVPSRVAFAVGTPEGGRWVVLDAGGVPVHEQRLGPTTAAFRDGALAWRSTDLEGDGAGDLLMMEGGAVVARGGIDLAVRWRWPCDATVDRVRILIPGAPGEARGPVVVWAGQEIFGLDSATGQCLWRGRVPLAPVWDDGSTPRLQWVPETPGVGLPGFALGPDARGDGTWAVAGTWATEGNGRFLRPRGGRR